jgi:hypothetical protein
MELLNYYFQDGAVVLETIDQDHTVPEDTFWQWVVETNRNETFHTRFDKVREDAIEVCHVFKYLDDYIEGTSKKDLEKDLTDYINEKITHDRNTDIV